MTDHQHALRIAMHDSLNWREPGATIVPSIPPRRRRSWRLMRWLRSLFNRKEVA